MNKINSKTVPISVQLEKQWNEIVQKCVQLRIDGKTSISELAKDFEMDRRILMRFEKGELNLNLADQYTGYFGKQLIIQII